MSTEQLLFTSAIEGTFVIGLGDKLTPALREKLKAEANIDLAKLRPAYPAQDFLKGVRLVQRALLPELSSEVAERRIGALAFEGFAQTLVGRAVIALTRVIGPERTLGRMAQNMRAGVNFMQTEVVKRGPGDFLLNVSEVGGLPYFYEGMFGTGLRDAKAPNVVVKVEETDGHKCVYSVKWTPR